jgi:hypothetical protein
LSLSTQYDAVHEPDTEQTLNPIVDIGMGRKRDLKNINGRRPPSLEASSSEFLNEWGESLERMTKRRRMHNERHLPNRSSKA